MTPEMYALTHDTSGPTKRIRQLVAMLKDKQTPEETAKILGFIEQCAIDINAAVDTFYLSRNPPPPQK